MAKKARANIEYTIATHAAEKMSISKEAVSLCEKIADGRITGDAAVEQIKRLNTAPVRGKNTIK